jgi:predicted RNA-binding Zn-ribbon protein involved in translation (DUF1610 family)
MFKRECENCGKKSYSSSEKGKWECPYCGKEIKQEKEKEK